MELHCLVIAQILREKIILTNYAITPISLKLSDEIECNMDIQN